MREVTVPVDEGKLSYLEGEFLHGDTDERVNLCDICQSARGASRRVQRVTSYRPRVHAS